jgi:hypothetical protein
LNQKSAIEKYEIEMRVRAREVRVSVVNTMMLHDWEKVMKRPVMTAGVKDEYMICHLLPIKLVGD